MADKEKVYQLIESSKRVILDCTMPAGGIVAAPCSKPYYPKDAKNYKFVWPRDGAFITMAARMIGVDVHDKFFNWCTKVEAWSRTGLYFEKYFINGKKAAPAFQPDQTGNILMSAVDFFEHGTTRFPLNMEKLIKKSASGLCKIWNGKHFTMVTEDLWEERNCFPDLEDNFTYSLAACYHGLKEAYRLYPEQEWNETADSIREAILASPGDYFYRAFGQLSDQRVDASLIGLVWPYGIVGADDPRFLKTLELMEKNIMKDLGVYRYEHDEYDGWMYNKTLKRKKGAGYWPLLSLWFSIYYKQAGNNEKAEQYFQKVIDDVEGDHIPEQVFDNHLQVAVSPLCWSHAMFIFAAGKLGYL